MQVRAIQNAVGSVTHVYHENLPEGGDDGLGYLEATGQGSHPLVSRLVEAGAALEITESMDVLVETVDLQRCLMQPLLSAAVATRLREWFAEANRRRYEFIAERHRQLSGRRRSRACCSSTNATRCSFPARLK